MNNAMVIRDEEFEGDCDDECCEEVPPTPKEQFAGLVQTILSLNAGAGAVYERLQATAAPFDGELVKRLRACQQADEALIEYCRLKMEAAGS